MDSLYHPELACYLQVNAPTLIRKREKRRKAPTHWTRRDDRHRYITPPGSTVSWSI